MNPMKESAIAVGAHRLRTQALLIMAAWLLLAAIPGLTNMLHADEVNLRASVRLSHDSRVVRLGDIAELVGEESLKLAEVTIAEAGSDQHIIELSVHEVRKVLDEAGVHWGRVNLNGGRVIVRLRRNDVQAPVNAMQAVSIHQKQTDQRQARPRTDDEVTAATIVNDETLRGVIARLFVQHLKVEPNNLRLVFERDARDLLATTIDDCQFQVEPHSSLLSEIVQLRVRCWSDGAVKAQHELTVRPLIAAQAVTVVRNISRNERLMESDIESRRKWLPPQEAALLSTPSAAVGQVAGRHLRPGDLVRKAHVKPEVVVQRGDLVEVHCLVGGAIITLQAEARAEGSLDEVIEVRKIGERQTFLARITGPGQATVDLARR